MAVFPDGSRVALDLASLGLVPDFMPDPIGSNSGDVPSLKPGGMQ